MSSVQEFVLPGLIDCHVHFREPGMEHKGTMLSEGTSAKAGGVVTVCDMPNTIPGTHTVAAFIDKVRRSLPLRGGDVVESSGPVNSSGAAVTADATTFVTAGCHSGGVIDMRFFFGATAASHLEELRRLWTDPELSVYRPFCSGLKLYLEHSTGDMKADDTVVDAAFQLCGELNIPLVCHCENCEVNAHVLLERNWQSVADAPDDVRLHSDLRPVESETKSVEEAIARAAKYGSALHVAHLSTKRALDLIKAARAANVRVTCEVAPHHLFLTVDDYDQFGTLVKVNVPLRTLEDRDAMWEGVLDGSIECISTDHAPHLLSEKGAPGGGCCSGHGSTASPAATPTTPPIKPLLAPSGIPGVEFVVPLVASVMFGVWPNPHSAPPAVLKLNREARCSALTVDHLRRAMYSEPTRIFQLSAVDAPPTRRPQTHIVDDPSKSDAPLGPAKAKCGWSPYSEWVVRGEVRRSDDRR